MTTGSLKINDLDLDYDDFISNNKKLKGCKIGKYTVTEKLGEGAYGSVWKGLENRSKETVAIKVLDLEAVEKVKSAYMKKVLKRLIKSEAEMMAICKSPNIIKCYDVYENESLKLMLMEYCNDGNLEMEVKKKKFLCEQDAVIILKQILNGLAELHRNKIVHRDLKPQNILIHEKVYKIADFGFSKELSSNDYQEQIQHTKLGTIQSMAPEVLKGQKYGLQADIWSIGVIFYFMLYGKAPYLENTYEKVLRQIERKDIFQTKHPDKKFKLSDEARSFISSCLTVDSQKRLNWTNIADHQLFEKYDLRQASTPIRKSVSLNKTCMMVLDSKQILIKNEVSDQSSPKKQDNRQTKSEETETDDHKNEKNSACFIDSPYEWSKKAHLDCQITEFILNQLIASFERSSQSFRQQRQIIEVLYLLSARTFLNMSFKRHDLKNFGKNEIVNDLKKSIERLYLSAQQKFSKYSQFLHSKESEFLEIIKDKLITIINCQIVGQKDIFMTGIEAKEQKSQKVWDYTKRQQIEFTQRLIRNVIKMIEQEKCVDSKILKYLSNYEKICNLTFQQVGKTHNFSNYIQNHFSS